MSSIRYIFSVNPGRSGSDYSTFLFNHAAECLSLHEDLPIMCGEVMRQYNDGNHEPLQALLPTKIEIMNTKLNEAKKRVLFDSNHCFVKGFGWEMLEVLPHEEIGVLVLRRDPDANAKALLRIHDVPGMNRTSRDWLLMPGAKENRTQPIKGANRLEVCRWYVDEIFVRGEEMRRRYPKVKFVDCTLDELNNYERVVEVFHEFGLEPLPSLKDVVGKRQNTRKAYPALNLERALQPFTLPLPDDLSGAEAGRLRKRMADELMSRPQFRELQPAPGFGDAVGASYFAAVISELMKDGVLDDLAAKFNVEVMYTELEHGLIKELVWRLRKGCWKVLFLDRLIITGPPDNDADESMDPFDSAFDWGSMPRMTPFFALSTVLVAMAHDVLWRPRGTRVMLGLAVLALCYLCWAWLF